MRVEIEVPEFTVEYLLEVKQDSGVIDGEWINDNNWHKISYLKDAGCVMSSGPPGMWIVTKLGELILNGLKNKQP